MTVGHAGKTKRHFFHRYRDHVSLISKKKLETPISHHVGLYHGSDLFKIHFIALDHIPPHERGGNMDKKLLQSEARWIYKLSANKYPGLNEAMRFKPFI